MTDLKTFLEDPELLALRLDSEADHAQFRKGLTIPPATTGFLHGVAGPAAVQPAGAHVAVPFDIVLVKTGDQEIAFTVENLTDRTGICGVAQIGLLIRVDTEDETQLADFAVTLGRHGQMRSRTDEAALLDFEVRRSLGEYAAARTMDDIRNPALAGEAADALRAAIDRILFRRGLRLSGITRIHVDSPRHDELRADHDRERRAEERHAEALRSQERREERVGRLVILLRSEGVQALLHGVQDDRARGLLYAKLMEEDLGLMGEDQLQHHLRAWSSDTLALVETALGDRLAPPPDMPPVLAGIALATPRTTSRTWVVAGPDLLGFNPRNPAGRPERFTFPGPLRCARVIENGRRFLGGGKRSAFLKSARDDAALEFPLPLTGKPRGGINSLLVRGGFLYATHSEVGLVRWAVDGSHPEPTLLTPECTRNQRTTRSVLQVGDDILFATGHTVYRLHDPEGEATAERFRPDAERSVTSLCATGNILLASAGSTSQGQVYGWELSRPGAGHCVLRRSSPIAAVRVACLGGLPHFVYAARDHGIHARVPGHPLETQYDANRYVMGLAEAASDFVCGLDADGRALLIWEAAAPHAPRATIDLRPFSEYPALDLQITTDEAAA